MRRQLAEVIVVTVLGIVGTNCDDLVIFLSLLPQPPPVFSLGSLSVHELAHESETYLIDHRHKSNSPGTKEAPRNHWLLLQHLVLHVISNHCDQDTNCVLFHEDRIFFRRSKFWLGFDSLRSNDNDKH